MPDISEGWLTGDTDRRVTLWYAPAFTYAGVCAILRKMHFTMIYQNRLFLLAAILTSVVFFSLAVPLGFTQQLPNETVVVTANASPVAFENLSRTVVVFDSKDIDALPIRTITDILSHAVSVDVRSRSPYGMQSDLSIRGSAYSQVLVLVDGVRINDAQTGHHNSDLPVQLDNVDRIEVLLGSGSSIYGADALGGQILSPVSRVALEFSIFVAGKETSPRLC